MQKRKKLAVVAIATLTMFASGCQIFNFGKDKANPKAIAVERLSNDSDRSTEYVNATPADSSAPEVVQYYDKVVTEMMEKANVTTDNEFTVETIIKSPTFQKEDVSEQNGYDGTKPEEVGDMSLRQLADEQGKKIVAVVDTGVNGYAEKTVNFTSDSDEDINGHGTTIAQNIVDNSNGQAMILGLKAMGDDGKGYMSDIMQAVQYAIDQKVDIINLSIATMKSNNTDVFVDQINKAIDNGITVVAAAGNYNASAALYIPASIDKVLSVGAINEAGEKIESSNYDADYYEVADSTSVAAAILSGKIAAGNDLSAEVSNDTVSIDRNNLNSSIISPCDTEAVPQRDGSIQYKMYYDVNVSQESLSEIYNYGSKYYITSVEDLSSMIPTGHLIYDATFNGYNFAFDNDEDAKVAWDTINSVENGPLALLNEKNDKFEVQYDGSSKTCGQHPGIHRWWIYLNVNSYGDSGVHWDLGISNSIDAGAWATYDFAGNWSVNIGGCGHSGSFSSGTFGAGGQYDSFTRSFGITSGDCSGKYGSINIQASATCTSASLDSSTGKNHFLGTSSLNITYATGHVQNHVFDLNAKLDGVTKGSLSDFGTANVTVGGTTKTGVQDYYDGSVRHGTSYSVSNIKAKTGYHLTSASSFSGTVNADTSVVPEFATNTYTVTYYGNGNTGGSTAKQTISYFTDTALNANGFTKTGYLFNGWNTKADGSGTSYNNRQSVSKLASATTNGQNVDMYAQWKPITYTIAFNANGGVGSTTSMSATYDKGAALTANGYSRTGYDFAGWNTRADGTGTSYTDKQSVKNLTTTNGGTVTLYAKWKAHEYDVIFNSNTPSGYTANNTMSNQHFVYDTSQALATNKYTITKSGSKRATDFAFDGWSLTKDGSKDFSDKQTVKNLTATNGGKVTLYARWRNLRADVVFKNYNLNNKESVVTGTSYKLQGVSYYGNDIVKYAVSGTDGTVRFEDVEISSSEPYTVSEVTPADNFAKNKNRWIVNVTDENAYTMGIKSGSDSNYYAYVNNGHRVYSEPLHSFSILKKNSYNFDTVSGVKFKLSGVSNSGDAYEKTVTTNASGTATFTSIGSGTYILEETAVPTTGDIRVELDSTKRAVVVSDNGSVTVQGITTTEAGKFVIIDKAIANGTVTVVKKWVDLEGETIDHSKSFPTIHIGTGNPSVNSIANLNKTNWKKIYTSGITDVVEYTNDISKSEVEAKGATKINETSEKKVVYAWKEGTKLYWWTNASTVYMAADSSEWFANNASLKTVNVSWDTSKVTSMKKMFEGCTALTKVDVGNDTTISKYASNGAIATAGSAKYMLINDADNNGIVSKGDLLRADSRIYKSYSSQPLTFIVLKVEGSNYELMSRENYKSTPYNATSATFNSKESKRVTFDAHKDTDDSDDDTSESIMDSFMITANAATEYTSTSNYYNPATAGGKTPTQLFGNKVGSGYWTKIDDKTYTYTFFITDASASYYVWEDDVAGYIGDVTDANPVTISNASTKVIITNKTTKQKPSTGSLRITNTVSTSKTVPFNENYDYTYKITLKKSNNSALTGTTTYGDVAFTNGVGRISLKQNTSKTISDIPSGYHYTVEQDAITANGATVSVSSKNTTGEIYSESSGKTAESTYTISYTLIKQAETTSGSFTINNYAKLSGKDTKNKAVSNTYMVSFSGMTPYEEKKYTGSVTGSFTADENGEAVVTVRLAKDQTVTFTATTGVKYSITSLGYDNVSTSYSASSNGALKKNSDSSAGVGEGISTALETVDASEKATFNFNQQFYYTLTVNSSVTGKTTTIKPTVQLNFPTSMKGKALPVSDNKDANNTSIVVSDSANAAITVENGKKLVISKLTDVEIDAIASSTLFTTSKYDGYTISVAKSQGSDGNMTSSVAYSENKYTINYYSNMGTSGSDTTSSVVVSDTIQSSYSYEMLDDHSSHRIYVDLTRNGNVMNYSISIKPIGVLVLNDREITIVINGVTTKVTASVGIDETVKIASGSFKLKDEGESTFDCTVSAEKTSLTNRAWTADFGTKSLGTIERKSVSSISEDIYYTENHVLKANPFTKTGYVFSGWNTKADGTGTSYTDKQTVSKLASATANNQVYNLYAQWAPITYTAKYAGNGATTGTMSDSTFTYDKSGALTPNKFEKKYTVTFNHNFDGLENEKAEAVAKFNGWSGSDGKTYTDGATVKNLTTTNGGTITMTAKWTNGTVTLPKPTRLGYTFGGWYTSASGGTKVGDGGATVTPAGNVVYYAHWTPISYTIKFDGNGNTGGSTTSMTVKYDQSATLTANGFTKTGYSFAGWTYNTTNYGNKATVKNLTSTAGATITMKANWLPTTYKISFDANGGSGTMAEQTFTYDVAQALSKNTFTRSGYTFLGWSDVQDDTTIIYKDQASVKNVVATKLYAIWQRNTYTNNIAHWAYGFKNQEGNNNNKDAYQIGTTSFKKGYGDTVTYTTGDATTIPNGFALNSTFGTSSYEGTWKSYSMGKSFTQPAAATYVQYTYNPINYTITYNLDGGKNASGNPSTYNVLYGVTFANPTKTGYTFAGWYIDNVKVTGINVGANATFTSSSDLYTKLSSRTTGNKTVTAKWTPNTYTVKYNGNGNTGGSTADSSHTYDTAKSLTANGFTRTGYTFKGWNTKSDGSGTSYADKAEVKNLATSGTVTLYAQWTINNYYIDLNGWLDGASSGSLGTMGTADIYINGTKVATGVKDYYAQHPYGTKYEIKNIQATAGHTYKGVHSGSISGTLGTGNAVVVLEFTTNKYTVAYDANGGTGTTASSSHTYDTAKSLTANGFTRTGYLFNGWNTAKDGSGTKYADKASVKNLTATNGGTVTLYAQWVPKVITATFHRNFNSSDSTSVEQKFTYGKTGQSFNANTWTREGYIFKGWSTNKSATSATWPDKCGVADGWIDGNYPSIELYAVWMPESFNWTVPSTITFDTNSNANTKSGTVSVTDNTLASGRTLNIKIASDASLTLKDKSNSANTRKYTAKKGNTNLTAGSTILSLPTSTTGSQAIDFSLVGASGSAQVAGEYQDILKFTATVN